VHAVAARRVDALERAMLTGRVWTLAAFDVVWAKHPLMSHLARGVVWRSGGVCFRLAEDGTFADDRDAKVSLAEDAAITVAHPIELDDETLARWRAVFADYEIIAPIDQLSRTIYRASTNGESATIPIPTTDHRVLYWHLQNARRFVHSPGKSGSTLERPSYRGAGEKIVVELFAENRRDVTAIIVQPLTHPIDVSEAFRDATTNVEAGY
jgi:hypothetical protein